MKRCGKMYKIEYSEDFDDKYLKSLPKNLRTSIQKLIEEKLAFIPEIIGIPLKGDLMGFWRLRISDYRIIYKIKKDIVVVLIFKIDHRKDIYR